MSILLKESKLVAPNHKMEIWRNFTFIVFIIIERKYLLNINENKWVFDSDLLHLIIDCELY